MRLKALKLGKLWKASEMAPSKARSLQHCSQQPCSPGCVINYVITCIAKLMGSTSCQIPVRKTFTSQVSKFVVSKKAASKEATSKEKSSKETASKEADS